MNLFSYSTVTPFEQFLLGKDWSAFRHVLIVRSGDGRFATSLRSALPDPARLVLADSRVELTRDEKNVPLCGEWDFDALAAEVEDHGPFDAILFLHFHEYWEGRIGSLTRLLDFLDPKGLAWMQFVNGTCLSSLESRVVRGGTRGNSLTNPLHRFGGLDFNSVVGWANSAGLVCDGLWGVLPPDLFEWATKKKGKETKIEFLKRKIPLGTVHDALQLGAPVGALSLRAPREGDPSPLKPAIAVARLTASGLQQLVIPQPEVDVREAEAFEARIQARALRGGVTPPVAPHRVEFLSGFTEDDSIRKVLLVGAAPSGDWMLLPRAYDRWEWTGVDHDDRLAGIWKSSFPEASESLEVWNPRERFPFPDSSFDLVLSLGLFKRIAPNLALRYLQEMLRVCGGKIAHLEDALGSERDLFARDNPLPVLYKQFGLEVKAHPMLKGGKPSGLAAVFLAKGEAETAGEPSSEALGGEIEKSREIESGDPT